MNLYVGPVAPDSARTWIGWAHEVVGELRDQPSPHLSPPAPAALDNLDTYLAWWAQAMNDAGASFRWQADVDPDELEYVTQAFHDLDVHLGAAGARGRRCPVPVDARAFHLVMVRALLHALAQVSPARATFVEQLRTSWPAAAQAL